MQDGNPSETGIDRRELDGSVLLMCSDGDPDLARALLGEFLDCLDGYVDALDACASAADWSEAAHRIKGAARSIGAVAIAGLAAVIEYAPPATAEGGLVMTERMRALAASLRRLHDGQPVAA